MIIATYNIHRCAGSDGEYAPERIRRVIDEMAPEILALQEVGTPPGENGEDQFAFFPRQGNWESFAAPTIDDGRQRYGNLLLSRHPIVRANVVDLSIPGREPRNAIDAIVETPRGALRVLATHFGLTRHARRFQARTLRAALDHEIGVPTVIMGDLNAWRLATAVIRALGMDAAHASWLGTYPSRLPLLPLDRILWRPVRLIKKLRTFVLPPARAASDHLPLIAELK